MAGLERISVDQVRTKSARSKQFFPAVANTYSGSYRSPPLVAPIRLKGRLISGSAIPCAKGVRVQLGAPSATRPSSGSVPSAVLKPSHLRRSASGVRLKPPKAEPEKASRAETGRASSVGAEGQP